MEVRASWLEFDAAAYQVCVGWVEFDPTEPAQSSVLGGRRRRETARQAVREDISPELVLKYWDLHDALQIKVPAADSPVPPPLAEPAPAPQPVAALALAAPAPAAVAAAVAEPDALAADAQAEALRRAQRNANALAVMWMLDKA